MKAPRNFLSKGFFWMLPLFLVLVLSSILFCLNNSLKPTLENYQQTLNLILLILNFATLIYLVISINIARVTLDGNAKTLDIINKEFWYRFGVLDVSVITYDLKPENGDNPKLSLLFSNQALEDNRVDYISIVHESLFPNAVTIFYTKPLSNEGIIPGSVKDHVVDYTSYTEGDPILTQKDVNITFLDSRGTSYYGKFKFNKPRGAFKNVILHKNRL